MDKFTKSVRLDEDLCKGCINCIKRCPTQAIRVRNGKAVIKNEFCIDCGECIRICPHHAKKATYDSLDLMKKFEYIKKPDPLRTWLFNIDSISQNLRYLFINIASIWIKSYNFRIFK